MAAYLLALNCGSSSLKTTLFSYPSLDEICNISASSIGSSEATLKSSFKGQKNNKSVTNESHSEIFSDVLEELKRLDGGKLVDDIGQIKIVTHRIVHGGTLDAPVRVSKGHTDALEKMEQVSLHSHLTA
jgi:acetate kinase